MHNIRDFITIKWSLYLHHKAFHQLPCTIKRRTKRTINAKRFSIKRFCLENTWLIIRWNIISLMRCHRYIVHDNSYLHPVTLMDVIRDLWYMIDSREKKDSIRVSIDLRDTKWPNTSGVVESTTFCKPNWWLIVILSPVFWIATPFIS